VCPDVRGSTLSVALMTLLGGSFKQHLIEELILKRPLRVYREIRVLRGERLIKRMSLALIPQRDVKGLGLTALRCERLSLSSRASSCPSSGALLGLSLQVTQ
jgi:hypothetical protein